MGLTLSFSYKIQSVLDKVQYTRINISVVIWLTLTLAVQSFYIKLEWKLKRFLWTSFSLLLPFLDKAFSTQMGMLWCIKIQFSPITCSYFKCGKGRMSSISKTWHTQKLLSHPRVPIKLLQSQTSLWKYHEFCIVVKYT